MPRQVASVENLHILKHVRIVFGRDAPAIPYDNHRASAVASRRHAERLDTIREADVQVRESQGYRGVNVE